MNVKSTLVKIPSSGTVPATEYIERELKKMGLTPLRWAIVCVKDNIYTVSVASINK